MEELCVWSRGRGPAQRPSRASTSIKKKPELCAMQKPRGRGAAAAKQIRVAFVKRLKHRAKTSGVTTSHLAV